MRQRVAPAVTAINALEERQHGKPRWPDEAAASQAAAAILAKPRVDGLVQVTVTTDVHEHVKRRYSPRLATTVRSERVRVQAASAEAPLTHTVRRLGWRVSATNHPAEEVGLTPGVAAYRSAQQAGATLTGISPGQPGRQTAQPTTERRLSAFRGVTLSRRKSDGKLYEYLTPLHDVQKCLLALMELSLEISDGLVT